MVFTKADLRNGDVCVTRSSLSGAYIAIPEVGILKSSDGHMPLDKYNGDLTYVNDNYSITDVYRPSNGCYCSFDPFLYAKGKHVFHREEEKKVDPKEWSEKMREELLKDLSIAIWAHEGVSYVEDKNNPEHYATGKRLGIAYARFKGIEIPKEVPEGK